MSTLGRHDSSARGDFVGFCNRSTPGPDGTINLFGVPGEENLDVVESPRCSTPPGC
jgi:hypothetical protein